MESATTFSLFWGETQDNPPPSPLREAAFPAFTASAPKAVHSTSVLSGSAAEGNEGAFRSRKIPSHTLPTRRLPSPSVLVPMVWQKALPWPSCAAIWQTQSSCEATSLSFVLSKSDAFSLLHCVLRTRQRSEFTALQQRALPGGTTGIEGSSHCFKAWALNYSLSFAA